MIPPAFDYAAPGTLAEAVSLLQKNPEAKLLAGGHSLIPMMRFRLAAPAMLIDMNRIDNLAYIEEDADWLKIGAMTREADLDHSDLIQKSYPLLADTARVIADPLVRNMATVGGNLAHADPANDHPATMLAYGAELVATGPAGERVLKVEEFFQDAFQTALAPDEILTEIRVPRNKPNSGGCYLKLERKVGDYAIAAVAVQLSLDGQGRCESAGIGLTNLGLVPIKAAEAEQALLGKKPADADIQQAAQLAADAAEPVDDQRGSAEYKRHLVKTLAVRAIRKALERAKGGQP
ncbi:MAG: xanthine dehydrogenase family protein subunit M [Calditrichaeota bacterium]|nr:MAG: xanthine dehydrogenase family protein subunit M [Calditrichota bacterium]